MIVDWGGLSSRMANMMTDAKKAIEEKLQLQLTGLSVIAIALIGYGLYSIFRRK